MYFANDLFFLNIALKVRICELSFENLKVCIVVQKWG